MEQSKACKDCKQILPLSNYYKHATNADGLYGRCKKCHSILNEINRKKNPAKWAKRARDIYWSNPELYRERAKQHREKYPDLMKQRFKDWSLANPEKARERGARRRARRETNGIFKVTAKEKLRLYNNPCFYCGSFEQIQIDHVIPIARGGRHSIGNLVAACAKCNNHKRARFVMEWRLKKSGVRRSLEQIERDRNGITNAT